ncbi:MAG: xanthine dehydrogenase family protein [Alphaproteobacteria bacterium]|nr:xanthine dehydrogenase family protein [Alphaproteobacteria bacterium]
MRRLIGEDIPRTDGVAKVTGAARYVDDLQVEGCLYGATVRSTHAHAAIRGITLNLDYDWSDVVVVTSVDVPGHNCVLLMTEDQPVLAEQVVRHVTEPVALVAAPTREKALEAARNVRIMYRPLPALLDPLLSEDNQILLHGSDNVFKRITIEKGDVGSVTGGRLISGTYQVGHQEQLYIEPQGMLAVPRDDGGITIIGSMQCPYYIQKALCHLLGHDRVNVVQAATGGGFGGKEEYPSMIAAHAALLALKCEAPVKLIYRRDEDLRATTKRHPAHARLHTRVDDDGRLLSIEGELVLDGGAYLTLSPVVLSRALLHLTGPYACENVHLHGKVVATHTPPNGAFRGFGAPQAMFAMERHMDRIARTLHMDPVEIRRINLLRSGDRTATGQVLDDSAAHEVLDQALASARASSPPPPARHPGGGGDAVRQLPGRGVSMVFHGCGFTGNGEARLKGRVALELVNDRIRVLTASTDIGQGTDTIFPEIVAEVLGVPMERVEMAPHDTAAVPDSGPTVASRTAMVVGGVVAECARRLHQALEAEVGRSMPFRQLLARRRSDTPLRVEHAYADSGQLQWDEVLYRGDAYPTYGWSCTVVDLAVDVDTGQVSYQRVVTATDVGRALNPTLCAGQIEGGVLQALGYATCEEVVVDDQGQMVNDRLTNYIIPTALDAPEMRTLLVEHPYAGGPFGAKGVGEIPMDGPAAAVAQAIEAATGAVLDRLPMTPERVLEAMP